MISKRILLTALVGLCLTTWACAQRTTSLSLIPGSVKIIDVTYANGTSSNLSQPASGQGTLEVTVGGRKFTKPGVTFSNLVFNSSGILSGINFVLDRPFEFDPGVGLKLELPTGQATLLPNNKISFAGKAIVSTPYRSRNGDNIQLEINAFEGSGSEQEGEINLKGMSLKGAAISEGIQLPGIKIQPAPIDLKLAWTPQQITSWKLTVPQSQVEAGIPGVATSPQYPLAIAATNLTLDQSGKLNCTEASITNRSQFSFPEVAGLKATVKGGKLTIRDSKPTITDLKVDVTLPPSFAQDDGNSNPGNSIPNPNRPPVTIPDGPNVIVRIKDGMTIEFPDPTAFKVGQTRLTASRIFIDLSTSLFGQGAPANIADPKWKGVWLPSGKVIPPLGPQSPQLNYTNFSIEPNGLSGTAQATGLSLAVDSFNISNASIEMTFSQNVLTAGGVSGNLQIPNLGTLPCSAEFNENGNARFAVTNGSLNFNDIGMKLEKVNAQIDQGGLLVGGELAFNAQFVQQRANQGMPQSLAGAKFGIQGMKIASSGAITLPQEGAVTLPNPLRIDFGPFNVEVRRVAFTATGNNIDSVTFSGGAALTQEIEGLPAAGELDFEGFKVAKDGSSSRFSLGGLGFKAKIPQLGSISASLYRQEIATFGDTLYGDAELRLECLGDMAGGIGLEFLLAPKGGNEPSAWFIGGSVETPPILVQAPASPPIPLFNINGFSGGFGMNVIPKTAGVGRISQPNNELVYQKGAVLTQVGVLLSDPASSGRIWWADTALTFTFNPVIVDLTARMAFLDIDGAKFLDIDEWRQKDRIARAFMNFDSRGPTFIVGGDVDLNFPTRNANLLSITGGMELFVASRDKHLYVGWPDGGQKPVVVRFGQAVKEVINIEASFGMALTFTPKSASQLSVAGGAFLDAEAKLSVPGAAISGGLYGDLSFSGLGTSNLSINGNARLDAVVDFGFFSAQAEADFDVALKNDFRISGNVSGSAGPFNATIPVSLTMN